MTVGHIFTKIGNFIENRQIFMLLNCNCSKLANLEDFNTCSGGCFFRGHSVYNNTTTTVLRPFVRDYPGELVPEETLTHPPS